MVLNHYMNIFYALISRNCGNVGEKLESSGLRNSLELLKQLCRPSDDDKSQMKTFSFFSTVEQDDEMQKLLAQSLDI